jgi:thioredoxin
VTGQVVTLTDDTFDDEVDDSLWLVDFWARWCAQCLAFEPVLVDVAAELTGRLRVGRVDVLGNPAVVRRFAVASVPTLLALSGTTVVRRIFADRKRTLLAELEELLQLHSGRS